MKIRLFIAAATAALLASCTQEQQCAEKPIGICPKAFGTAQVDGKDVSLFTLKNANGMVAQLTNLGAKVVTLYAPDREGKMADVVLGYSTADEYAKSDSEKGVGEVCFGATVGRYGNRIAEGKFNIDGKDFQICVNENGTNSLHGGFKGLHSVVWDAEQISDSEVAFTVVSPDGHMGYPGEVAIKLTYKLTDCNALKLSYEATTTEPTVLNLTHHSFFNLAGEDAETINDHEIQIPSESITPVDDKLIPTGDFMPVAGTPFDFNQPRVIADSLQSAHQQMKYGNGYDHNWVLSSEPDSTGLRLAAKVKHAKSGRVMTELTAEPAIQFYGGNFLNGSEKGKSGKGYPFRSAFCLETQHFPDSPNKPQFPSTVLRPGEKYNHVCVYKFSAE